MKTRCFLIPVIIFAALFFATNDPKAMPEKYNDYGYCLEKAVWLADQANTHPADGKLQAAPAVILIGMTDAGGLHAEAVYRDQSVGLDGTISVRESHYIPIDGKNDIVKIMPRAGEYMEWYTIDEAKDIIANGNKFRFGIDNVGNIQYKINDIGIVTQENIIPAL